MNGPQTIGGRGLAAFLRGLLPETNQFERQIAEIEQDAAAIERRRATQLLSAMKGIASDRSIATLSNARAVASRAILDAQELESASVSD